MGWSLWGASLVVALCAAAYLQIPTFVLGLGYRWFHRYGAKRWFLRLVSVACLIGFVLRPGGEPIVTVLAALPVLALLVFSLVNSNPRVYVALRESDLVPGDGSDLPEGADEAIVVHRADGSSQGYPLEDMVVPRHLVHHEVDGAPILVSYCMACRSALVYGCQARGLALEFDVLGVYRRNMVMVDRQTGTVWQQGTGEAMFGALAGECLEMLPYQVVSWRRWREVDPSAILLREAPGTRQGLFSKERLRKMLRVTDTFVAPGRVKLDGLPLRTRVLGIAVGRFSKAYPEALLEAVTELEDRLGDQDIFLSRSSATGMVRAHSLQTGEEIPVQRHWWFGWKEFHPDTAIWGGPFP